MMPIAAPLLRRTTELSIWSVLHSHVQEEDENDQHDDTPQRERPALARHALDLPAARPDAQPGLMGAGGMPNQQPGDDRDDNDQGMQSVWGYWRV